MWPALIPIIGSVLDKLFPNPAEAAAAKLKLMEMLQAGDLAQLGVNQAEASNPRLFVAGWRPFIGWVCGSAFAWNYLLGPMITQLLFIVGHPVTYTPLDLTEMMPVLLGMLGLGGMRTYEKLQGKA